MAGEVSRTPDENLESLIKEADTLKARLEDERLKLNDVTRKFKFVYFSIVSVYILDISTSLARLLAPSQFSEHLLIFFLSNYQLTHYQYWQSYLRNWM